MSVIDSPSLVPTDHGLASRASHPGRAASPPRIRPGWNFPETLRRLRRVEMLAILRTRTDADAVACAAYFAEVEGLGATTAEHQLAILARRLAEPRDDGSLRLTMRGHYASVLLVRSIASAVGLHVITTGRQRGVTFARCACGWMAELSRNGIWVSFELDRRINAHLLSTVEIESPETAP